MPCWPSCRCFLRSIGYSELNKADPDCGTTFTWASRAFGPKTGWAGGWGIVAADVLVMASLAQVAGQYFFLLSSAEQSIGANPSSGWVLLVGVLWIVVMTYICYRGIEVSANFQKVLLGIELVMLLVLSVTALIKVGTGHPAGSLTPSCRLAATHPHHRFSAFVGGIILMLFIYWGWDTAVSVNEETKDKNKTPGRAAIISTVLLLVTYVIVIVSMQSFAGIGTKGVGLANPAHQFDVLSVTGGAIFGTSGFGTFLSRCCILMVLSLGCRLDPDHDPADRPHHPVDGRLQGSPAVVRQDPPQEPDADRVHDHDGRHLHRPVRPAELPLRR